MRPEGLSLFLELAFGRKRLELAGTCPPGTWEQCPRCLGGVSTAPGLAVLTGQAG